MGMETETAKATVINRETLEVVTNKDPTTAVVVVAATLAAEVIITSKAILEACSKTCRVVTMVAAAVVVECIKEEEAINSKVDRTSKATSRIRTTITRQSNANSLKAAEIVLTEINVLLPMDLLSYK